MGNWLTQAGELAELDDAAKAMLSSLQPTTFDAGTVIFRPGDASEWFPVIMSGRVGVYLTGPTGRDILLYSVTSGQTCVQTTLGLLGKQDYTSEAIAETPVEAVIVPKAMFEQLIDCSEPFRRYVFAAFANRLQLVTNLLERVAFITVEERLATALLERVDSTGVIPTTHHELATAIGSVREVVSRRLELFAKRGLVTLERGEVRITDAPGLQRLLSASVMSV